MGNPLLENDHENHTNISNKIKIWGGKPMRICMRFLKNNCFETYVPHN